MYVLGIIFGIVLIMFSLYSLSQWIQTISGDIHVNIGNFMIGGLVFATVWNPLIIGIAIICISLAGLLSQKEKKQIIY